MKTTKIAALVLILVVLATVFYFGKSGGDAVKPNLESSQAENSVPGLTGPGAAPEELRGGKLTNAQTNAITDAAGRTCAGLQYFAEEVSQLIDDMTESEFHSVMKKLNSFQGAPC